jgi:citrate synthase
MSIKEKLGSIIPEWRERTKKLVKESGDVKVGEVNIAQVYGGMRDVKSMVTDISYVDPNEGIRFRGYTIPEVIERLPRRPGAEMPSVGGLFYLLLIGEFPTLEEAQSVEGEWRTRMSVPEEVYNVLRAMPKDTHPMTMLSTAVLALQRESIFTREYHHLKKDNYWEATLEDSLNLTAKLPTIAAFIYRLKYRDGKIASPDPNFGWAGNLAYLMGIEDPGYRELTRLYMIIHSDHESGNASAHATHLVASTLSDVYYAFSGGLNALAGPLHGLANQECLMWLQGVYQKYSGVPSREELEKFAWDTLNSGQVIPGYGHAVLRKTDPRFTAQHEYGLKHFPEDDLFKLAAMVYEVVPQVLLKQGKAKDPWPNVDAISGALQHHYGVTEADFYTVLFGVSRALGVTANTIWSRALGQPIERPKSLTTKMLEDIAAKAKAG